MHVMYALCMYVCTYVSMHICMHVCMYVYMYMGGAGCRGRMNIQVNIAAEIPEEWVGYVVLWC